jgi:hypothetical protein
MWSKSQTVLIHSWQSYGPEANIRADAKPVYVALKNLSRSSTTYFAPDQLDISDIQLDVFLHGYDLCNKQVYSFWKIKIKNWLKPTLFLFFYFGNEKVRRNVSASLFLIKNQ